MSFIEPNLNLFMLTKVLEDERVITTLRKNKIDIPYNVKRVLQVKK